VGAGGEESRPKVSDWFVVVESDFTMRGHRKPRFFREARARFARFENRIVYMDLDGCEPYAKAIQRLRAAGTVGEHNPA
jgi:hypothetical protein